MDIIVVTIVMMMSIVVVAIMIVGWWRSTVLLVWRYVVLVERRLPLAILHALMLRFYHNCLVQKFLVVTKFYSHKLD